MRRDNGCHDATTPEAAPEEADPLGPPRAAVEGGHWGRALELLDEVGPGLAGAEALELRAQALYATGSFEAAVSAWEDLHALHRAAGEQAAAARAAAMVALYLMIDSGLMAPVRGWLRRAERLLEGTAEEPAHALIALVRTYERFMCGDTAAARLQADLSVELGERLGVAPAAVIGRVAGARLTIFEGDLDGGLDELDEVAALLMSGEVDPLTTGMMYCELICAAQGLALHDRVGEWTQVMDRWRPGAAIGGISGRCRVHRAEVLRMSGPCDLAEQEALEACEELRPWMRREFGWPLVELGNTRLRKGDLAGAEEAFLAAHQHVWTPHPGLAMLRLQQGDVAAASALIADAIAHPIDVPSKERPPMGELRLAPLLDAQVEIAVAAGDVEAARGAADALAGIAARYRTRGLGATAALAQARAALAAGDVDGAIDAAGVAAGSWADIGAPFEAAVARTVLGEAHRRAGNAVGAQSELRAAHAAFEAFGAARWAAHAAGLIAGASARVAPPAAPAGGALVATFRCRSDTRELRFGPDHAVVRDLKGFRYVERLLAEPGRELHVLDLVAVEAGGRPAGGPGQGPEGTVGRATGGLPILDDQARAAYRRRLADVDEDIEEATETNDLGRLGLAQRDREYLVAELARAVGLRGQLRTTGGSAERARASVARSIRYALARLAEHHPTLSSHLAQCVSTGTYCSYTPDPLVQIRWEL